MDAGTRSTLNRRELAEQLLDEQLRRCDVDLASTPTDLTHLSSDQVVAICRALVDSGLIVLHGSHSGPFEELEPRQANDAAKKSGNERALYATVAVEAALMHAIVNKPYLLSTLSSFTLGYAFSTGRIRFRASENLYRLFLEHSPELFGSGYVYVLAKDEFTKASDSFTEYHSGDRRLPLLVLKVPGCVADDLFIVGRGSEDTIVEYSSEERVAVDAHVSRLHGIQASQRVYPSTRLDAYKPSTEWYLQAPSGIHGLAHAARVLVWADFVGRWMVEHGEALDLEVVRWAATLHDIRRMDDGRDLPHGERAAHWIHRNRQKIDFALSDVQLEALRFCCTWHVPPDQHAPTLTSELVCLKDADALDRVRLGEPQSAFLRTPCARAVCNRAEGLFLLSEVDQTLDRWEAVKNSARQLGLWQ